MRYLCLGVLIVAGVVSAPLAAQTADLIRGRVTSDSGRVVRGGTVIITRGPDRAVRQTTTDSAGRYELTFDPGTGDYLVAVSAVGLRPARRRVQRTGTERVLVADFVLSTDLTTLAAISVRATKPERVLTGVNPFQLETGSAERWVDGVSSQLAPAQLGSTEAVATTMPGITIGPSGASVLGAGGSSNLTTLNGLALGAAQLPRGARVETRVSSSTYDATRGGFSGAATDVRLAPGDASFQRRQLFALTEPTALQVTDAVGRALGAPAQTTRVGGGADGEAIRGVLTYHVAADVTRTTSDPATLRDDDPLPYQLAGVAPDSAARLRAVASGLNVPLGASRAPDARQRTLLSVLGRADLTADSSWQRYAIGYVTRSDEGAIGYGPLSAPAAGGRRREQTMGVQFTAAHFFGPAFSRYHSTRLNVSRTTAQTTPYLALPGVDVLVRSPSIDGSGLATLRLGGNAALDSRTEQWTIEAADEYTRNARGRRHVLKGALWGRVDGDVRVGGIDRLGSYSYRSTSELAAGQPASFSRTLSLPDRRGVAWNGAAAVSHSYAPSRYVSLLYGVRVEANGFATTPDANPLLAQTLGVRTDQTPQRVHLSPRFGFSYTFNRARNNGNGSAANETGRYFRYATGVLRGGIGEFRDLYAPRLIGDAAARTGLAGQALSLTCVGAAIPLPDWSQIVASPAAVPSSCVDGSGLLAERAPSVLAFAPDFDVPRSWRASLDYNTARWHLLLRANALASFDLSQPGLIDANFAGREQFRLAAEGDRPVYVAPAAIDAATGAVSAASSRRSADFARVGVRTSDLRGYGGLVTVSAATDFFDRFWRGWPTLSLSYTLQQVRRQQRGFDGEAFDDPRRIEWAPGATDARHLVIAQAGLVAGRYGTLTLFSRLQSGLPFTPIVQGDMNGDGRSGDRAYIPSPEQADPAVADGLRALRTSGAATARRCLAQTSGAAPRNGCRGPWTQTLNAQWSPNRSFIRQRLSGAIFLHNVLGGLDQLVHGRDGMRGWGGTFAVDPVLFVPRGFDPTTRRFRYDVNPRFAETRPSRVLQRDPFRVTIDLQLAVHTNFEVQSLRQAIAPVRIGKRWERRGADSLLSFYLRGTSSIHRALVEQSDSLFLLPDQLASLRAADSVFADSVRRIYQPLAEFLAAFDGRAADKTALDRVKAAEKAYWALFWRQPEIANPIVTPQQRDLMPLLKNLLATRPAEREGSRYFFGARVPLRHQPAVPPPPSP